MYPKYFMDILYEVVMFSFCNTIIINETCTLNVMTCNKDEDCYF